MKNSFVNVWLPYFNPNLDLWLTQNPGMVLFSRSFYRVVSNEIGLWLVVTRCDWSREV